MMPVLPPDEAFIEVFIEILCKSEFNICVFEILTLHVIYLIKFNLSMGELFRNAVSSDTASNYS